MNNFKRVAQGPIGLAVALLLSSMALGACSADSGKLIPDGNHGAAPAAGNTPGAGSTGNSSGAPGAGSFITSGPGSGGIISLGPDTGGTSMGAATGAGGAMPGTSDGHIGPAMTNNCADAAKFQNASGAVKMLYPYDGTVFPRGLGAPLFMWDTAVMATQIYIEAKSGQWSYIACPQTPDGVRYQLPDDVWKGAASWSGGPNDPVVVKMMMLSGGKVVGPATLNLKFALATLKGAIYYNSYQSKIAMNNGAVLKLVPGEPQPTLFLTNQSVGAGGPCRSCHALSANGTTMTVNNHLYPGIYYSESYDVRGTTPTLVFDNIPEAGFAGVYPDGSRVMTNGPPNASLTFLFPSAPGDVAALTPDAQGGGRSSSKLLDTKTGKPITATGWNVTHAQMPTFSPDGKRIVYNDYDQGPESMATAGGMMYPVKGHTLWIQDFDAATNTFSNPKQIYSDPVLFPAWPFFTPDSQKVVFATDSRSDFVSQVPDLGGPPTMTPTGRGHLMIIDLASGMVTPLDAANGYKNGMSYLPAGEDRDNNLEFFPTVSPISGGGYAWVLFTSRRTYGNLWTVGLEEPASKKIWVSAVNTALPPGQDPSNPPFLLPGQEIDVGNIRAFAALEPCKEDGQACTAGSECCKGYCSKIDPATGIGMCGKTMDHTCSRVDDKCEKDSDCCQDPNNGVLGRPLYCIKTAGSAFCAQKGIQ
jgi:hypothetical protein